jgi:hypothetical protein
MHGRMGWRPCCILIERSVRVVLPLHREVHRSALGQVGTRSSGHYWLATPAAVVCAMCSYDSGEVHRYSLQSTMKLRPSLQARKDLAANVREALSAGCDENQNRNKQTSPSKTARPHSVATCVGRNSPSLLQPGDATLDARWLFSHPTALELSAIVLRNVTYTPPKDVR